MSAGFRLHDKVERILADHFGVIEVDRDGDFTFPVDSTRVFIQLVEQDDRSLIKVSAPVLRGLQPTAELYKHLALHAGDYFFGSWEVRETGETLSLWFYYTLLGDYVDPDELKTAIGAVGSAANNLDDDLQERFGGKRYVDKPEQETAS